MLGEPVEFLDDLAQNFTSAIETGAIEQAAQRAEIARNARAEIGGHGAQRLSRGASLRSAAHAAPPENGAKLRARRGCDSQAAPAHFPHRPRKPREKPMTEGKMRRDPEEAKVATFAACATIQAIAKQLGPEECERLIFHLQIAEETERLNGASPEFLQAMEFFRTQLRIVEQNEPE